MIRIKRSLFGAITHMENLPMVAIYPIKLLLKYQHLMSIKLIGFSVGLTLFLVPLNSKEKKHLFRNRKVTIQCYPTLLIDKLVNFINKIINLYK